MPTRLAIHHETRYRYDRPVRLSPQLIRLRPAPHARQPIASYALRITPAAHTLHWQQDPFGNFLARVTFPEPTTAFTLEVDLTCELLPINPFGFLLDDYAVSFPFDYTEELAADLAPLREVTENGPLLQAWLQYARSRPEPTTIAFLVALNQELSRRIDYTTRLEPGVQTAEETLALGRGSCRDSAWLLVQTLRQLGLAARFVSGYLIELAETADAASDAAELHAWAEVFLPGAGWVGLDATSGLLAAEYHLPLAGTRTPAAAAPVTGTTEPCTLQLTHTHRVTRLDTEKGAPGLERPAG
jgi:transglutaminase-like putative cysteine protease